MIATKEQEKSPKDQNEAELGNEAHKELKAMIIKMFKELRRNLDEQSKKLEVFQKS